MANEAALNMQFFNENINGTKNIHTEYKQTIEKEDHIITGECYLNYLFSNDYMKPFVRKNYEIKQDKKTSYFDKLNIFNYKGIFKDILNKSKKNFVTSENESIKRILNILGTNYETSLNHNKFKNKYFKQINTKYSSYLDNINQNKSAMNNNKLHSSFDQYILPKINNKANKNSYDLNNDIFRTTSCIRNKSTNIYISNDDERRERKNNKIISYYSPLLKKNIFHIFKKVEDRENLSVKKSRYIKDGIRKIAKEKFNIDSYDLQKNKYKIKYIRKDNKKFCLINLFPNIGKVNSTQEIEKILFNKNEVIAISKLRSKLEKKGIRRVNKNLKLIIDSEKNY